MRLYRRDREIQLLHLGRAHTEGDVFVYLPKEKVVITGDAVIGWTPYEKPCSAYGDYRPWRAGLAANIERTFAMVS
jgi:glyoxylase-like metal-dependent hydrolase (beta-lactamase superfamily II)